MGNEVGSFRCPLWCSSWHRRCSQIVVSHQQERSMSPESFALAVAVVMFGGGLLGLVLQGALPEHHTTGGSRDMIGAVVGLLTLLCALVTGLLIWTAYGVYSGQNAQIQAVALKVMQLDLALTDYGPEATAARAQLRE